MTIISFMCPALCCCRLACYKSTRSVNPCDGLAYLLVSLMLWSQAILEKSWNTTLLWTLVRADHWAIRCHLGVFYSLYAFAIHSNCWVYCYIVWYRTSGHPRVDLNWFGYHTLLVNHSLGRPGVAKCRSSFYTSGSVLFVDFQNDKSNTLYICLDINIETFIFWMLPLIHKLF